MSVIFKLTECSSFEMNISYQINKVYSWIKKAV